MLRTILTIIFISLLFMTPAIQAENNFYNDEDVALLDQGAGEEEEEGEGQEEAEEPGNDISYHTDNSPAESFTEI